MAKAKVYFAPVSNGENLESIQKKITKLFEVADFGGRIQENDLVALKVHFGEPGTDTHISPDYSKPVVDKVLQHKGKPFLTDSNTLYCGGRGVSPDHIKAAVNHGYTFDRVGAPVIILGGLTGNDGYEVPIPGIHYDKVSIAQGVDRVNSMFVITHITGHLVAGFGGSIKNMGMGLASRRGKLDQHSDVKPFVQEDNCRGCGVCIQWCPAEAIEMKDDKACIVSENCIGCGECLATCRYKAIGFNWSRNSGTLQEKMVEHAYGVYTPKKGRVGLFNFLINITKDCDCLGVKGQLISPDIGILVSDDPVAVDQATFDLFQQVNGKSLAEASYPHLKPEIQINHAVKIGLGSRDYELEKVE